MRGKATQWFLRLLGLAMRNSLRNYDYRGKKGTLKTLANKLANQQKDTQTDKQILIESN